jgi:hypothetical protein
MEPFDAYRYYMAIKLHFESDTYNAIKYHYKTSAKPQSFWKRKDKYYFAKIAKRFNTEQEMIDFYVCHFSRGVKWVGEMLDADTEFTDWKKRRESLTYFIEFDLQTLSDFHDTFDALFEIGDESPYPRIINYYFQEHIDINTVAVLDRLTGFLDKAKVNENQLYPEIKSKIQKYGQFIQFDRAKITSVIMKHFVQ